MPARGEQDCKAWSAWLRIGPPSVAATQQSGALQPRHDAAGVSGGLMAFVRLLRPQQWIKNTFILAGPIFGKKLDDGPAMLAILLGFVCLCLVSSSVYVFNDIR